MICYTIGYYGGRPFVARWGKYVKLDLKKLDKFHEFSERYGTKIIFISPLLAGDPRRDRAAGRRLADA